MSELKWTDKDMINFAQQFSEYEVAEEYLDNWKEQVRLQAIDKRVQEIVSGLKDNPELLQQIESIINSKNNQ